LKEDKFSRRCKHWTEEERSILIRNYDKIGPSGCARLLPSRTLGGIKFLATKLKLSDPCKRRSWPPLSRPPEKDIEASEKYKRSVYRVYLIGKKEFALVEEIDLPKVLKYRWYLSKSYTTSYAITTANGHTLYLQHVILATPTKIDHRNRNGLDNVRKNLRKCTGFQNMWNRGIRPRKNTVYKGIVKVGDRINKPWRALIRARAYDKAALKHHGQFAVLNER